MRVAQDDIWSEVEVEADASLARRRAKLKEHAAKEHAAKAAAREQAAAREKAAREKAEREPPPFSPASRATSGGSGGDGIPGSDGAARDEQADDLAYDDDDLLEAWDELCAEEDGGRGMMLDVDGVAQLLQALGKPVGCYELQYIVSKVGDETGRVGLPAFRAWWDAVLREFAEWCATERPASANMPQPQAAASSHLSPEELAASAAQEVERARAAAVASSHAEAERVRWERHIAEKQRQRVLAHRDQQRALEEEALAKRELVGTISERLARKVRGKPFVAVLRQFGLPVPTGANGATVHKAYRRALALYHPDRATRQGLPWQKVAETEEVYKLLQLHHDAYLEEADG